VGSKGTISCPAARMASAASRTARAHAGAGLKNPSSVMTPTRRRRVDAYTASLNGSGGALGSSDHVASPPRARII
jgi:hypothetical protein